MGEDSSSSKDDDEKKKKNGKKNGHKKPKKAEEDTNSEEEEEGTEDIEEEEDEEEEEETTDADIETATSNELELEPVSTEVVPSGRVVHTEHHDLSYLLRNFPLTEEQGKCLEGVRCVLKYVTK